LSPRARALRASLGLALGVALGIALSIGVGAATARAEAPRAAGGARLVEALEAAPAAVVGVVAEPRALDPHGYTARLHVEAALAGALPAGAEVRIAWEELARARPPRFAEGERVLVALEPLPGASLWAQRFSDPEVRARVLAVGQRGDAFLRSPSQAELDLLGHYLALAREPREGAQGVALLCELAASAAPALAQGAVESLGRRADLARTLDAAAAARLVAALLRPDATPGLTDAWLALAERERPPALRPPLEALAAHRELAPPAVFEALARLGGELGPERRARLLAARPAAYREVAVRNASGPGAAEELARLARSDAAPEVRAAAVLRLVALRGTDGLDGALGALHDSEAGVRGAAARALGTLGAAAVPGLRRVVDANDPEAARAAVVALHLTASPEAGAALVEIADSHPDEGVRALAAVALGRKIGHTHD
jgi:hypothetical protein